MTNIKLGDKVVRDAATVNDGKVRLGEGAPISAQSLRRQGEREG